jgi:transposase, IS30 family
VEQAHIGINQVFPELTSITLDNDLLFRHHEQLEQLLGLPIYFCRPYASWQKGTIENYNR